MATGSGYSGSLGLYSSENKNVFFRTGDADGGEQVRFGWQSGIVCRGVLGAC